MNGRFCTLAALMCCSLSSTALALEGPISEVVVYADRAQVTRTLTAECATGEVVFSGLPSNLEPRSLWGALTGGGEVVGLTHREETSGPRPEAKTLQDQIRKLDDEVVIAGDEIKGARATLAKLAGFQRHMQQVWGLDAAGRKPAVQSWDAALDLLRQQALGAHLRQRQTESRLRDLQRQRARLVSELQAVAQKRRRTTLAVTVLLKCTGRRTVNLSYIVPNATWEMGYQVRTQPGTGRATLVVQAAVHQGTGEDWNNVTLAVSTANLQRRNLPPSLQKMRVSTHEPADTRKVLTRRFEQRRHLVTSTTGLLEAKEKSKQDSGGEQGVPDTGVAFKLTAARRVTVPGDGRRTMVVLEQKTLTGRMELETVPKLFPFVYRKVSVANPFRFTLLPGRVELYDGRTFIGQTAMKLRAPHEPFAFSLGVDNQLQVKRYVKKEKVEGERGYGHEKKLRHRYVLEVGNWTAKNHTVKVQENVPVSQVRELEVTFADDSTRPSAWNKTDGIMTWELKLPPRSKKQVTLDYTVHLPKTYIVQGY